MNWVTVFRLTACLWWSHPFQSRPALSLPACPSCARCCLVGVAMAPRGPERGFTCSILCSLHRGPLMRDWGAVTQNTQYTKAALWTDAQDSAALSNTHGVSFPCPHSTDGQSQTSPNWVTFCTVHLLLPDSLWPKIFFFLVGSCF